MVYLSMDLSCWASSDGYDILCVLFWRQLGEIHVFFYYLLTLLVTQILLLFIHVTCYINIHVIYYSYPIDADRCMFTHTTEVPDT